MRRSLRSIPAPAGMPFVSDFACPAVRKNPPGNRRPARAVCPLADYGTEALSEEFLQAALQAGEELLKEPEQQLFLKRLTAQQDELLSLRKRFGGK